MLFLKYVFTRFKAENVLSDFADDMDTVDTNGAVYEFPTIVNRQEKAL